MKNLKNYTKYSVNVELDKDLFVIKEIQRYLENQLIQMNFDDEQIDKFNEMIFKYIYDNTSVLKSP